MLSGTIYLLGSDGAAGYQTELLERGSTHFAVPAAGVSLDQALRGAWRELGHHGACLPGRSFRVYHPENREADPFFRVADIPCGAWPMFAAIEWRIVARGATP